MELGGNRGALFADICAILITICNQICKFTVQPCKMIERRVHIISQMTAPAARGSFKTTCIQYVDN